MKKEQIILIGGGGHCKSCIDVIEFERRFEIAGILDLPERVGEKILGYPIVGTDGEIDRLAREGKSFLITLGQIKTPEARIAIYRKLRASDAVLPVIVSPLAHVSRHASIGEGTIIMHQALVNADALVGANCIVNNKALIEHDAVIGDHCHISTASVVNGGVKVGSGSFYGSGAVSKQYADIPDNSFIRANSLFTGH